MARKAKQKVLFVGFERDSYDDQVKKVNKLRQAEVWFSFEVGPDYVIVGPNGASDLDETNISLYGSKVITLEALLAKLK